MLWTAQGSRLWITWTTPGVELKALDVLNNLRLWMTWTTLGCKLRVLDAMNNLRMWMIWTTGCPWAQSSRCYEQLKVKVDVNDSRSWDQGSRCYENLKVVDDITEGKNRNLYFSQVWIRLGTCITILCLLLNPMHNKKKIVFLYFKRIQKVLTKTVPQIQMFLTESNPHCEDEYWNHRSLINLKSSTQWL